MAKSRRNDTEPQRLGDRFGRREPTLGTSRAETDEPYLKDDLSNELSQLVRENESVLDNGFAAGEQPRRRHVPSKRKGFWLQGVVWLVILVVMGGGGTYVYWQYTSSIVSLNALDSEQGADDAGAAGELAHEKPPIGYRGALNKSQLRWCFREDIRVKTLQGLVRTNGEISRLNTLRNGMKERCSYNQSAGELVEQARTEVEARIGEIITATENNQLVLLASPAESERERFVLVRETQRHLQTLGYDVGGVDGLYGVRTQAAIKAFEKDNGLDQVGQPNFELLKLLRATAR